MIISFLLFSVVVSSLLSPRVALSNGPVDSMDTTAKAPKKTKKAHKKAKAGKTKVSKTSAGAQDEVSDQSDVSQQADKTGTKKKR
jgi:hypothetical protein